MDRLTLKNTLARIHTFEDYERCKSLIAEDLVQLIIKKHDFAETTLLLFSEGTNIVYAYGNKVIKIFPPFHHSQFASERLVLKHLHDNLAVETPALEYDGELSGWPYLIMSKLQGTLLEGLWETLSFENKTIILHELGRLIHEVHSLPTAGLEAIDCHWPQFIEHQIAHCLEQHQTNRLPAQLVQELPAYLNSVREVLPELAKPVLLTGEYTPMNFLVQEKEGIWHISGLIDFGDAMLGLPHYDLLGPGAFLIQGNKALLRTFLQAYGYLPEDLTPQLTQQLTTLMLLHQYSNLNIQIRIPNWQAQTKSLSDLANLVWGM